jgi:hypothetical protein
MRKTVIFFSVVLSSYVNAQNTGKMDTIPYKDQLSKKEVQYLF